MKKQTLIENKGIGVVGDRNWLRKILGLFLMGTFILFGVFGSNVAFAQDGAGEKSRKVPASAPAVPRPAPTLRPGAGDRGGAGTSGGAPTDPASRSGGTGSRSAASTSGPVGSPEGLITPDRTRPPELSEATEVTIDFIDMSLYDLIRYFADLTRKNFILGDPRDLQGKKVTIISHHPVPVQAAYEAFLSALEVAGYTTTTAGSAIKVVKSSEAGQTPISVGSGGDIPNSDQFVTQIIPLKNVTVNDVTQVVNTLVSRNAKVIAYAPSNTLIVTEAAHNLRRVFNVVTELDIAAPKSTLEIFALTFAEAGEVKQIIEELYGSGEDTQKAEASRSDRVRRSTRRGRDKEEPSNESVSAGKSSKYISKVIDDERTNSLIVLANEEGHTAVVSLIERLDVDADPQNQAKIHVVYLEHAAADEVQQVLSELSQSSSGSSSSQRRSSQDSRRTSSSRTSRTGSDRGSTEAGEDSGAIAAFDSGMRIAADEKTNS